MTDAISHEQFAQHVNEQGGASRNFSTFEAAQGPGIMVSHPNKEQISNLPLTGDEARRFVKQNEVHATGHDYHGAWVSGGKVFQDVSRKQPSLDDARRAGTKNKQIAGYDLGAKNSKSFGADAWRPEGGEVFFDRNVPGIDKSKDWTGTSITTSIPERMSPKPSLSSQEFADQAHLSRGATVGKRGKKGTRPISINEVYATIAKNRRNRGV